MALRTERETLNGLIEICRDGSRGFRLAARHVSDPSLKRIFDDAARQRRGFADELRRYAYRLGGAHEGSGTARGALHRGWLIIRDAIADHDDRAVLAETVRGEAAAANTYIEAIGSVLPPDARIVVERQYDAILDVKQELSQLLLPAA